VRRKSHLVGKLRWVPELMLLKNIVLVNGLSGCISVTRSGKSGWDRGWHAILLTNSDQRQ